MVRCGKEEAFLPIRRMVRLFLSVLVIAAAMVTIGCRSETAKSGLIPVRLQTDWYPQPEHGGFYTAQAKGYYQQEGLDVTILPGGPYTVPAQVVSTGGAEFAMGSSDHTLEAVSNGLPLLAVAATMQHDPQAIMVHENSPVKRFEDLDGHTVAVQPGSTWFKYLVKRYRLDHAREVPATFTIANFLTDPNYIQQIFVTSEPFFARKAGAPVRTFLISDTGFDPYRVLVTTGPYAKSHPDVVAKFVRASLRGWQDYLRDPAAAHAVIQKLNPAMNPELMAFSHDTLVNGRFVDGQSGAEIGKFDPARWAATNRQLTDLKVVDKPIDPATAYTLDFLPK
jgi:NitT/TauT family transport system substrate-binding protein